MSTLFCHCFVLHSLRHRHGQRDDTCSAIMAVKNLKINGIVQFYEVFRSISKLSSSGKCIRRTTFHFEKFFETTQHFWLEFFPEITVSFESFVIISHIAQFTGVTCIRTENFIKTEKMILIELFLVVK